MNHLIIKSTNSPARLEFCEKENDYFSVVFTSPAVTGKLSVWGYTDCEYLVQFFQAIANEWRGWKGIKEWASIEGEFRLEAESDNLGHVILTVHLNDPSEPEPWSAKLSLGLEVNQLEEISKSMSQFFAV
jgi:hypothetical protein